MKLWKDMTPEEKGALLLAHHEGKEIQYYERAHGYEGWEDCGLHPWNDDGSYRVKPKSKVELVSIHGYQGLYVGKPTFWFGPSETSEDTHRITFNLVDGVPDCSSIKMEKL